MREIKARVWFYDGEDLSTGEWYTLEHAMLEQFVIVEGDELRPFDECSIIVFFTGLKDKTGKEIYEGDIIQDSSGGHPYEIVDSFGSFSIRWKKCCKVCASGYGTHGTLHEYLVCRPEEDAGVEIIGNIYSNPELLK